MINSNVAQPKYVVAVERIAEERIILIHWHCRNFRKIWKKIW